MSKTFDQIIDDIRQGGDSSTAQLAELMLSMKASFDDRFTSLTTQNEERLKQQEHSGLLTKLGVPDIDNDKITEFESQTVPNTPFTYGELKARAMESKNNDSMKFYADALKTFATAPPAPSAQHPIQQTPNASASRDVIPAPSSQQGTDNNNQQIIDFVNGKIDKLS